MAAARGSATDARSPIQTTTNTSVGSPPPVPVEATESQGNTASPQSTGNGLTATSPGRPFISAPILKHSIQNSAGFSSDPPPPPPPAGVGPSIALEPGVPPVAGADGSKADLEGSARAVALARADSKADSGSARPGSSLRPDNASDSDAEDMRQRAAALEQEHGAVLGSTRRPFERGGRAAREYSPDSSENGDAPASAAAERDGGRGAGIKEALSGRGVLRGFGKLKTRLSKKDGDAAGSSDSDEFEEAHDRVDEPLSPPPAFKDDRGTPSPARSTRFKEELSD